MFDLAKDLGLYVSERYSAYRTLVDRLETEGDDYYIIPAKISIILGGVGFSPMEGDPTDILRHMPALNSPTAAFKFMMAHDLTARQVLDGAHVRVKVDKMMVEEDVRRKRPDIRMGELMLSNEDNAIRELLRIYSSKAQVWFFILFGLEVQAQLSDTDIRNIYSKIPKTDFGIKNVERAEEFLSFLEEAGNGELPFSGIELLEKVDGFLAMHGRKIERAAITLGSIKRQLRRKAKDHESKD